jgi:uncharacterized protein
MHDPTVTTLPRTVMWRRIMDDLSFEQATLSRVPEGYEIMGVILVAEAGTPLRIDYRLRCGLDWRTREVDIEQVLGADRRSLRLTADGVGAWRVNGVEAPELTGCIDVDLEFSPSTNALPINRLRLKVGERAEVSAAWVRFPALQVMASHQAYHRLGQAQYVFQSLASGFEAILDVDHDGLPVLYSGIWQRIAEGASLQAPGASATRSEP